MKTKIRILVTLLMAIAMGTQVKAATKEAYAVYNNGTITFYYDANRSSHTTGTIYLYDNAYNGYNIPQWSREHSKDMVRAVFDESFAGYTPKRINRFFYDCKNLTTIVGIEKVNTSLVTDMKRVFMGCRKLQGTLDLNGWDTSKVTDMSYMFESCESLTNIKLGNWNTSSVTDMGLMFYGCEKLTSLDVSRWNTFSVTNMRQMFCHCKNLSSLDLSNWDTSGVTNMESMFGYCFGLNRIYCSSKWSAINVSESYGMFLDCSQLVGEMGTTYQSTNVDATYAHIDASGNPGYLTSNVIPIDKNHFPDDNFRKELRQYECADDGKLTVSEILETDWLDLNYYGNIQNLKGIEFFTELDCLNFTGNYVKTVDLSKNRKLNTIDCYQNQMRGTDMDDFITNLPTVTGGKLYVYQCEDASHPDGNEMTAAQVTAAKSKGWTVYVYDNYDNDDWAETDGYWLFSAARFPDENFRNRLIDYYSWPCIGAISAESAEGRTSLACVNLNVSSLEGIEYFPNITELLIYRNNLKSVDLSNNKKLYMVNCSSNNIKGTGMDNLIASLPTQPQGKYGWLRVINNKNASFPEGNVITAAQVAAAKTKGWIPQQYNGSDWVEYSGNGITTDIRNGQRDSVEGQRDEWYTIDGRKVYGKPDAKGVYISNGKKVVIK